MKAELREQWRAFKKDYDALYRRVIALWEDTMDDVNGGDPTWRDLPEGSKEELATKARKEIQEEVGDFPSLPNYLTRCAKISVYGCSWDQSKWSKDKLNSCLDHVAENFSAEFKKGKQKEWLIDQANKNIIADRQQRKLKQQMEVLQSEQDARLKEAEEQKQKVAADIEASVVAEVAAEGGESDKVEPEQVVIFRVVVSSRQVETKLNRLLEKAHKLTQAEPEEILAKALSGYLAIVAQEVTADDLVTQETVK